MSHKKVGDHGDGTRCIIRCPKCGKEYSTKKGGQLLNAKDNLTMHMEKVYHINKDQARKMLVKKGIIREGQNIQEAIKEYDRLVAEGVIVE